MVFYLVDIAHAFVPAALVCGLVFALVADLVTRRVVTVGLWAGVAGLIAGGIAYTAAPAYGAEVQVKTAIMTVSMIAAALVLMVLALRPRFAGNFRTLALGGVIALSSVLSAQAMFAFLSLSADRSLTATTVLNTELIANISAILIGGAVVAAMVFLVAHVGRRAGRATSLILAVALIVLIGVWCAEVMLGLLQLGVLDVTSGRVSFVAKLTRFAEFAIYVHLGLLALLIVAFFLRRPAVDVSAAQPAGRALRRKRKAVLASEMRWLKGTAAVVSFLVLVLLYHDLHASLPPSLSEAAAVSPDEEGLIEIPVDSVKDGKLHRFAYVASDGHRVRFFLINRYDEDHVKIGVVYDACMICGDDGYIQKGNEVICIACNVRVFIPSIGKPGGCNPIPLRHEVQAGNIVIDAAELEKGARYFSEIVEIEVTDPVTGETLINLEAPFQYDFKGKTFFFGSQDSYDTFKAAPETYAGETVGRYFRVQGHQTTAN